MSANATTVDNSDHPPNAVILMDHSWIPRSKVADRVDLASAFDKAGVFTANSNVDTLKTPDTSALLKCKQTQGTLTLCTSRMNPLTLTAGHSTPPLTT
jgi:hypothetical protein